MLKKIILIGFTFFIFTTSVYAVDWEFTLAVSIPYTGAEGDVAKSKLLAGVNQTATDGFDHVWDTTGLFNDVLRAYFLHGSYHPSQQHLWRDIRANQLPQEWEILVQPSQAGASVTLSWSSETLSGLPSSIRIRLVDLDSGSQELDMRSVSTYAYVHADPTMAHHFRIIADEPGVSTPPAETPPQEQPPVLTILTELLPPGILHRPYTATLEVQEGTTPYRWDIVSGGLPRGLKLDATTGTISGKPKRLGQYTFTIQLVDANGQTDQKSFTLSVVRRARPSHER